MNNPILWLDRRMTSAMLQAPLSSKQRQAAEALYLVKRYIFAKDPTRPGVARREWQRLRYVINNDWEDWKDQEVGVVKPDIISGALFYTLANPDLKAEREALVRVGDVEKISERLVKSLKYSNGVFFQDRPVTEILTALWLLIPPKQALAMLDKFAKEMAGAPEVERFVRPRVEKARLEQQIPQASEQTAPRTRPRL